MSQEEGAPLNEKGHMDFVMLEGVDVQAYPQYAAMRASERRSLPSTNFWRQKNGQPLIPVPPEDRYYYHYFRGMDQVSYVNTPLKKKEA